MVCREPSLGTVMSCFYRSCVPAYKTSIFHAIKNLRLREELHSRSEEFFLTG